MAKYSKKLFRKKRPTLRSLAKRISKIQADTELKEYHAYDYSGLTAKTAATTTLSFSAPKAFLLNGVDRGNLAFNRIGDEIQATSYHITARIEPTTPGQFTGGIGWDQKFRVLVVCDKDPMREGPVIYGLSPAAAGTKNMLFNVGTGQYPMMITQYNTQDRCYDQYDVLYDEIHTWKTTASLGTVASPATPFPIVYLDIKRPFRRMVGFVPGTAGAGTIASMDKNSLYLYIIANGQVTNIDWTVSMDTKFFYKDA